MGKAVRKNRRSAGEETKKTIKNIIQKMVLSRPFRLLDTTFNIHILTWEDLRHNRKTVPVSCETGKNVCHVQNEEKVKMFGEINYSEPGRWTSRKKVL